MDEKKVSSGMARRPPKHLAPNEEATIATLASMNVPQATIARLLDRDRKTVASHVQDIKLGMVARAVEYADLHLAASQKAAAMGNAVPSQWALERLGVVDDPKLKALEAQAAGPRFSVQIGIALPGMSTLGDTPRVVSRIVDTTDVALVHQRQDFDGVPDVTVDGPDQL